MKILVIALTLVVTSGAQAACKAKIPVKKAKVQCEIGSQMIKVKASSFKQVSADKRAQEICMGIQQMGKSVVSKKVKCNFKYDDAFGIMRGKVKTKVVGYGADKDSAKEDAENACTDLIQDFMDYTNAGYSEKL